MKFKINGRSLAAVVSHHCIPKIIRYLDSLAFGELVDGDTLAENIGYARSGSIKDYAYSNKSLASYTQKLRASTGTKRVWGNKRTIKELRKHKELCAHEAE